MKRLKKLRSQKGMTMVEVMVAMVIIVLATTLLASGFLSAASYFNHGTDLKNEGGIAATKTEQAGRPKIPPSEATKQYIVFGIPGTANEITVYGRYQEQNSELKNGVNFKVFVANSAP